MIYIIIALLLAALAVFVYVQSSGYNIVEYELSTCKDIGGPVKFVMLSDLHDTDVTHDGNRRLLRSIESINPDFVILAGDMITSYMQPSYDSDVAFDFLRELANRFTVYYGVGNHEQRYKAEPERFAGKYDKLVEFVQKLGIHFLSDSYIDREEDKIRIYGFDIPIDKKGHDDYLKPWKFRSDDGSINLNFTPIVNRSAKMNLLFLSSNQNQVFGRFEGYIMVEEKRIYIDNLVGFAEKVSNKW